MSTTIPRIRYAHVFWVSSWQDMSVANVGFSTPNSDLNYIQQPRKRCLKLSFGTESVNSEGVLIAESHYSSCLLSYFGRFFLHKPEPQGAIRCCPLGMSWFMCSPNFSYIDHKP